MHEMIDTHCHLNFGSFEEDRSAVIERAAAAGVSRLIVPGVDLQACDEALALAAAHSGIYAAVGIHPNDTGNWDETLCSEIERRLQAPRVVAVGEIGLDYHWDKSPHEVQHQALKAQLALAAQYNLPVILHNREATEDILSVLAAWVSALPAELRQRPGVLHSFSGNAEQAERAAALGFYLGFTGPLTYKKADEMRQAAAITPLDRILVETDAPFLTPAPHRGKRNEPAYIPLIVEVLARVKDISAEEMAQASTENALRLFHLGEFNQDD